jgi:hypothetical protein
MNYHLHQIEFISQDSTWLDRYWQDPSARLTYLLRHAFSHSFWEFYAQEISDSISRQELLMRSKWNRTSDRLYLSQIWTTEAAAQNYQDRIQMQARLRSSLEKQGFQISETNQHITHDATQEYIREILQLPHIFQFLDQRFGIPLPNLAGDPLKRKIVTPYQNRQQARDHEILFASLFLPPVPKKEILKKIKAVPASAWMWDDYRQVDMLPLMTSSGHPTREAVNSQRSTASYRWTEHAPSELINYFDQHIWDWMETQSRVMILKTKPGARNQEHIDCSPADFHETQLKLRIVLQGQTDSLYFITHQKPLFSPKTEKPYLIDGSWPHGMLNNSPEDKYTICVGAPWTYSNLYPPFEAAIYKDKTLLPQDYERYFDQKYRRHSS